MTALPHTQAWPYPCCLPSGVCEPPTAQSAFTCQCGDAYHGPVCGSGKCLAGPQYPCTSVDADATCADDGAQGVCRCSQWYVGTYCTAAFHPCAPGNDPCLQNALCQVDGARNVAVCRCRPGTYGPFCELLESHTARTRVLQFDVEPRTATFDLASDAAAAFCPQMSSWLGLHASQCVLLQAATLAPSTSPQVRVAFHFSALTPPAADGIVARLHELVCCDAVFRARYGVASAGLQLYDDPPEPTCPRKEAGQMRLYLCTEEFYRSCVNDMDHQAMEDCDTVRWCSDKTAEDYATSPFCVPWRPGDPLPAGYTGAQARGQMPP